MCEFDLVLNNIKLRIVCEEYKREMISELISGYAYLEEAKGNPTYTLVMANDFIPKNYQYYIKMVDKWFDNATCDVWIDNMSQTIYMNNIEASNIKWEKLLIQYFACNVFSRLLEEIGYISFHSSCVEKNGNGIAFIAPRNHGKTNCMLNLINAGFNFVTNDKIAIQYDGKNLNACGIAQDISIRLTNSFITQEQNKKYLKYINIQNVNMNENDPLEGRKIHLFATELSKLNNVSQTPLTHLKNIILPSYNPNIKKVNFQKMTMNEICELLDSQRLPVVHDTTDFLRKIDTGNRPLYDESTTINEIMKLDFYNLSQGENSTNDFIEKTRKLIKNGTI